LPDRHGEGTDAKTLVSLGQAIGPETHDDKIIRQARQQIERSNHGSVFLPQDDLIPSPKDFNFLALQSKLDTPQAACSSYNISCSPNCNLWVIDQLPWAKDTNIGFGWVLALLEVPPGARALRHSRPTPSTKPARESKKVGQKMSLD